MYITACPRAPLPDIDPTNCIRAERFETAVVEGLNCLLPRRSISITEEETILKEILGDFGRGEIRAVVAQTLRDV